MEANRKEKRILVVTSVSAERDAVLRGLGDDCRFDLVVGGVGPVAAAISTAKKLATAESDYELVVCAGICGGFAGQADIGTIVVASEILAADLGAETPDGYCSLDELGFGSACVPVDQALAERVTVALQQAGLPVVKGPVLTLSTVTGTASTAEQLARRVPGAAAEAMEGYGVASAAHDCGLPVLEIRTVSNPIGPRDKSAWRIKDALDALQAASAKLVEVL